MLLPSPSARHHPLVDTSLQAVSCFMTVAAICETARQIILWLNESMKAVKSSTVEMVENSGASQEPMSFKTSDALSVYCAIVNIHN